MRIDQLNSKFGIPGQIEFIIGKGGLPMIKVQNQHASALISLLGGQLLSYRRSGDTEDLLFLSTKSFFEDGKAIRGGIPVCWPWFGPDPESLNRPNHGFVRNHFWSSAATHSTDETSTITLQFSENIPAELSWKQSFTLVLEFNISDTLGLNLTTQNYDAKPFAITQAFHTYFNIGDINQVEIVGLENCRYFDKLDQGKQKTQSGTIKINEETDRIYETADNFIVLHDAAFKRKIQIHSQNCKTGVVWNPWGKAMPDLEADAYRHFVCVETGNIAFDLVHIPPGCEHSLAATYKILSD